MFVVLSVVAIVIIRITDFPMHFVQDQADHVGAEPMKCLQNAGDPLPASLSGPSYNDDSVHSRRHLKRLGKAQQRWRVQDDEVIVAAAIVEKRLKTYSHQVGCPTRYRTGGQNVQIGNSWRLQQSLP